MADYLRQKFAPLVRRVLEATRRATRAEQDAELQAAWEAHGDGPRARTAYRAFRAEIDAQRGERRKRPRRKRGEGHPDQAALFGGEQD